MNDLFGALQLLDAKHHRIGELLTARAEDENYRLQLQALIKTQSNEIDILRARLSSAELRAEHAEQSIAEIRTSTSWAITRPLRRTMRAMRKAINALKTFQHLVRRNGGGLKGGGLTVYKAFGALQRFGPHGVVQRYRLARAAAVGYQNDHPLQQIRLQYQPVQSVPTIVCRNDRLLSVIICVHNAPDDVRRCLASYLLFTGEPCELIIVDDGSAPETRDLLAEFAAGQPCKLVRNEMARGYTFAANQGLAEARGDYLILLNSDTIVTPEWAERLIATLESAPEIGIAGPLSNTASWQSIPLLTENGDWAENPLPTDWDTTAYAQVVAQSSLCLRPATAFVNGFCFAMKRAVLDALQGFDEQHFGAGYGEENDFCLRAAKAGWQLRIADDAYVYHAQSKSYSHERRKMLCDRAGETLAQLHGQEVIEAGVQTIRDSAVMHGVRVRAATMLERAEVCVKSLRSHEGRRVLFFLPVIHAGGGANVVISEALAMRQMGVDAQLLNFNRCRPEFERAYPGLSLPVVYFEDETELPAAVADFDAVIATANFTVALLEPLRTTDIVLAYYIQDYEPNFYSGKEEIQQARQSYHRLEGRIVRFCKTEWNAETLSAAEGVVVPVVGVSYQADLFAPREPRTPKWPENALRIVAMVRPASIYRGPAETMVTLAEIAKRYGDQVQIEIFGCSYWELETLQAPRDFPFSLHGQLTPEALAGLLPECDIFVDFSHYQAMGLTAMEAMACGLAVIVPEAGGAGAFARHEHNALVVDTHDAEKRREALARLIDDHELRQRLARQAIADLPSHYPERVAAAILDLLFTEQNACQ